MSQKFNIALLGATGAVGETLLEILEERQFPIDQLFLLASQRSAGNTVNFKNKKITIQTPDEFDFSQAHICFSAIDSDLAKKYVPKAAESGCVVIDKSSCFRYEADIPLVIPEVNPEALLNYRERNIIATPNCSTIPLLVALKPIYDAVGIDRINVATYQSVSGTGKPGIDELSNQVRDLFNGKSPEIKTYPVQIAFNLIPHIDDFLESGYTKEEMKLVWESHKILNNRNILINPTAVRVPVFYGHSAAVHIETGEKLTAEAVKQLLQSSPGIMVIDEHENAGYPTPVTVVNSEDAVYVGRIREDISHPLGLNLWVVADNIRKGAALNAVQIAELLISEYF